VKPGDVVEVYFYDASHFENSKAIQDYPKGFNDKEWKRFADNPDKETYDDFVKETYAYYMGAFTYPKK